MSELKTNKISTNDQNNVAIDNALGLKSYTTTQRDALTSVAGDMIYNTTLGNPQVYTGSTWNDLKAGIEGTEIEYLIVAGGGRGGRGKNAYRPGGGGGAGGYITSVTGDATPDGSAVRAKQIVLTGTNYNVTIGAGGGSYERRGGDTNFHKIYAIGGACSWGYQHVGSEGASGGGNGDGTWLGTTSYISWQGNVAGGNGAGGGSSNCERAGGGGAGEAGGTDGNREGGDGLITTIITSTEATTYSVGDVSGSDVYFAGGGAGGGTNQGNLAGAIGGGGTGTTGNGNAGGAGDANTGGGGGGGGNNNGTGTANGGNGGSGVVILRYPNSLTITVGAGLTSSTFAQGSNNVTIFTAGTGNVSWA